MRNISILTILIILISQFICVQAQEKSFAKGTEKVEFEQTANNGGCYVFSKYVVKTAAGEDVGEDLNIFRRGQSASAKNSCGQSGKPYFTIKNADANYFAGLSGEFLFVDSGTASDSRGLEVFNLQSKKSIYSTDYLDEFEFQIGGFVVFDKATAAKGSLKNCSEAAQWKKDGLSVGWVKKTKLDLQTLRETPTGAIRCRAFQ